MMEASTISAAGFLITRLNGHNYSTWSQKVCLLLKNQGLWKVVSDTPDLSTLDDEDDAGLIAQFHRDDEKALSLIGLTLEDQQLMHIEGLDSAKACCDALRAICVRDSVEAQIHLMQKLLRARLQPGGDMLAHLEFMKRTLLQLQEKELILQQVYIILCSLDASYDQFVANLEVLPQAALTLANMTSRLLDEDHRRRENALRFQAAFLKEDRRW